MRIPGCFNSLLDEDDLQLVSSLSLTSSDTSQSILDIYSHTLLSALSLTQMGKHWTVKVIEFQKSVGYEMLLKDGLKINFPNFQVRVATIGVIQE